MFIPASKHNKTKKSSMNQCIIEHDSELFEGLRNGTSWYTGTVGCCGANYKFHRHYGDEKANPKYCFLGPHTTNPEDVKYNNSTIKYCMEDDYGKALYETTKKAYEQQMEHKKRAREAKQAERESENASKRLRIEKLQPEGKTREARHLRAEMLGMDLHGEEDEFNSDVDPDGCEEFDCASDSSLVPPWGAGGSGSDSDDW